RHSIGGKVTPVAASRLFTLNPRGADSRYRLGRAVGVAGSVLIGLSVLCLVGLVVGFAVTFFARRSLAGSIAAWVPVAAVALAVGQGLRLVGRDLTAQARLRQSLALRVDGAGVAWEGASTGALPWNRVRRVAVTA